jgi:hypothetical protein
VRFLVSLGVLFLAQVITLWGTPILLTGDQKTYLSIATEMHSRGSWLIPYLFGETSYLKPPLQLWATLVSWEVFGFSLAAAILPSIIAWVFSAFFLRETLRLLKYGDDVADTAGLLLMGTFGAMTYGTTVQMDVWILFFWTLIPYLAIRAKGSQTFVPFLSVWIATGILAWVKGPLYSVLMGISLLVFLRTELRSLRAWFSILVGAAVGLSWFFLLYRHDPDAFMRFLLVENGEKMGGNKSTILDLWIAFFASLLPIGLLLPISFRRITSFWWIFYAPIAVFFTFFPYRVGSYLFPLTAPALVMIALRLKDKPIPRAGLFIGIGLSTLLGICSLILFQKEFVSFEIAASFSILLFCLLLFLKRSRPISVAIIFGLLMATTRAGLVEIGNPEYVPLKEIAHKNPERSFSMWIPERHWWHEFGWLSSNIGKPISTPIGGKLKDHIEASGSSIWILTDADYEASKMLFEPSKCAPWVRIARRGALPKNLTDWLALKRTNPRMQRTQHFCSKEGFRFP